MGILSALTLVFVVLKAFGLIAWPWLVCFIPLIIEIVVGGIILLISIMAIGRTK